jgi:NADP-dependent 3-hydroxy acid dehydrogenase YdfG
MNGQSEKVVLITGAARGIGHAAAKRFLADGWRVALLDIDNETLTRNHQALEAAETTLTGQMLCVDGGFEATGIGLPTMRVEGKNG